MKGFASNLINRHTHTETNIVPRLRGRFEPEQNSFHDGVTPAPVNAIDSFSERINPDESKGPDADTETSTYRPIANTARRDNERTRQPEPEPEAQQQVTFSAVKAAFTRPAAFEVNPIADDFKPGDRRADNAAPDEPGLPGKRQIAGPYQHNFNISSADNGVKGNENGIVWPRPDVPENSSETMFFAGNRKPGAAPENIMINGEASGAQVNNPVQPATGFKSLNTVAQNGMNAVSPPNISNGNMRDGGQKSFGQTAQPVIKVTIGRIEVKAVHPQQAPAPVQRREPQKPILTLDDFLSQHKRNGQ